MAKKDENSTWKEVGNMMAEVFTDPAGASIKYGIVQNAKNVFAKGVSFKERASSAFYALGNVCLLPLTIPLAILSRPIKDGVSLKAFSQERNLL